jgi:hypothetical protein
MTCNLRLLIPIIGFRHCNISLERIVATNFYALSWCNGTDLKTIVRAETRRYRSTARSGTRTTLFADQKAPTAAK